MFSLFKNDRAPYSVQRIQEGELLHKATLADVHTFFNNWLNKRLRKSIVGSWVVLHQDDVFVYWGKPIFKGFFRQDKTIVELFYKTPKRELDEQFPLYKNHYQDFLWQCLLNIIKEKENGIVAVLRYKKMKGVIKENQLHINVPCILVYPKEKGAESAIESKENYEIVLDNKTMDLITIKQQEK